MDHSNQPNFAKANNRLYIFPSAVGNHKLMNILDVMKRMLLFKITEDGRRQASFSKGLPSFSR